MVVGFVVMAAGVSSFAHAQSKTPHYGQTSGLLLKQFAFWATSGPNKGFSYKSLRKEQRPRLIAFDRKVGFTPGFKDKTYAVIYKKLMAMPGAVAIRFLSVPLGKRKTDVYIIPIPDNAARIGLKVPKQLQRQRSLIIADNGIVPDLVPACFGDFDTGGGGTCFCICSMYVTPSDCGFCSIASGSLCKVVGGRLGDHFLDKFKTPIADMPLGTDLLAARSKG